MESGQAFSLKVVAYNRQRKKGGDIKEYAEAILVRPTNEGEGNGRPPTRLEQLRKELAACKRDPRHRKWYTRNIRILQNGFPTSIIRTIHPPLVIEFNGQKVVP